MTIREAMNILEREVTIYDELKREGQFGINRTFGKEEIEALRIVLNFADRAFHDRLS